MIQYTHLLTLAALQKLWNYIFFALGQAMHRPNREWADNSAYYDKVLHETFRLRLRITCILCALVTIFMWKHPIIADVGINNSLANLSDILQLC